MADLDKAILDALAECEDQHNKIEDEANTKQVALQQPHREELQVLYNERQPHLDAIEGFWESAISAQSAPTAQFLNTTTDPKLLRAITSFRVDVGVKDGKTARRVVMKFRPNIFIESAELFREINSEMETVSCSGIKWKANAEKAAAKSIFLFFSESSDEGEVISILDALDQLYANPMLFLKK